MDLVSFITKMEAYMMDNGEKTKCMAEVYYFMPVESQPMTVSGRMINSKDRVFYTMKLQFP